MLGSPVGVTFQKKKSSGEASQVKREGKSTWAQIFSQATLPLG